MEIALTFNMSLVKVGQFMYIVSNHHDSNHPRRKDIMTISNQRVIQIYLKCRRSSFNLLNARYVTMARIPTDSVGFNTAIFLCRVHAWTNVKIVNLNVAFGWKFLEGKFIIQMDISIVKGLLSDHLVKAPAISFKIVSFLDFCYRHICRNLDL